MEHEAKYQRGTIRLVLVGIAPERVEATKTALLELWGFTKWKQKKHQLEGIGEDWLLYDIDETIKMLAAKATYTAKSGIQIEAYVETSMTEVARWEA